MKLLYPARDLELSWRPRPFWNGNPARKVLEWAAGAYHGGVPLKVQVALKKRLYCRRFSFCGNGWESNLTVFLPDQEAAEAGATSCSAGLKPDRNRLLSQRIFVFCMRKTDKSGIPIAILRSQYVNRTFLSRRISTGTDVLHRVARGCLGLRGLPSGCMERRVV
jgi:hypothetical protein